MVGVTKQRITRKRLIERVDNVNHEGENGRGVEQKRERILPRDGVIAGSQHGDAQHLTRIVCFTVKMLMLHGFLSL